MVPDQELAAAVLAPHFDAVRDRFVAYEGGPDGGLSRLKRTKLVVDPSVRDSERHYAACREDGLVIMLAPEAATLPIENLVAILVHEFGHATDFLYPARWVTDPEKPGVWISDPEVRPARKWSSLWHQRSDDQIEFAADSIAWAVTSIRVGYCGKCVIQCFSGPSRPIGLR